MERYLHLAFLITLLIGAVSLIFWLLPQLAAAMKRIRDCKPMQERSERILDRSEADQRRAAEILDRQEALMARVEKLAERLERRLAD